MSKLTEKQRRFADYYIELGNATEAARKAGYSEKTANEIGAQNLAKLSISEYIQSRLSEMSSERIADCTEVLETLTAVMRREAKEVVVVTCKSRTTAYDEDGKKCTTEREEPILVEIPTRISDVNRAAELLGKRYGLFKDNISLDGDMELKVTVDYGDNCTE